MRNMIGCSCCHWSRVSLSSYFKGSQTNQKTCERVRFWNYTVIAERSSSNGMWHTRLNVQRSWYLSSDFLIHVRTWLFSLKSGLRCLIVNPDTNEELSDGQEGEIWLQSPSVAKVASYKKSSLDITREHIDQCDNRATGENQKRQNKPSRPF